MYIRENTNVFSKSNKNLWGIVLAGGDGNRLKNFIEKIYGYYRPKQFCTIIGTRSLIRHTIDRAKMIIPTEKVLTIITKHHSKYVAEEIKDQPKETIVVQPYARETGAGVLLPIIKIFKSDRDSTIAILPSDHFIVEEEKFMQYVNEASFFIESNPDKIAMFGIKPDYVDSGFGWIEKSISITHEHLTINKVERFWEKPSKNKADELFMNGGLLNTFILVGKSRTFLQYAQEITPDLFDEFIPLLINKNKETENLLIEQIFQSVPLINFSSDFLTKICEHLCVIETKDIYWSDWGEEQRVISDLKKIEKAKYKKKSVSSEELAIFN